MICSAMRLSLLLLVATASCAQAAFPNFTNLLAAELTACVPAAQSDIQCLVPVIVGLQRVQTVVVEVHNISSTLQGLSTAASTTNSIASLVTMIPIVGQVLSPVALVISGVKSAVEVASRAVGVVDGVTWRLKPSLDTVLTGTNRAVTLLNSTASRCVSGGTLVRRTRNTVSALPNGPVRGNLSSIMETFSSVVRGPVNLAVRAMSTSGSACASIRQFVSSRLPNTTVIKEGIDTVSRYISPIFQKLNNLWNKDYCLSPFKVAKDDAEIAELVDLIVLQKIAVRSYDGADFTDIATLKKRDTRALQQLRVCINLRNITNSIKGFPDYVINAFYKVLNATLSEFRVSSPPGLPSFTPLQDFANSLSNQILDLQFNFTIVNQLTSTKLLDCPAAVLEACSSARQLSSVLAVCYNPIG